MGPSATVERVRAWSLAVSAMLSVQLGAAVSIPLLDGVGAGGVTWLRPALAGAAFLTLARPRVTRWRLGQLWAPTALGAAIEFLGPLSVAALVSTPFSPPQAWGHLDGRLLLLAAACALLAPFLPWTCELDALRRLSKTAFGTVMALEPASPSSSAPPSCSRDPTRCSSSAPSWS